jgi:hypothetical protein
MKKFSQFLEDKMNGMPGSPSTQSLSPSEQVLKMFGNLDPEDRKVVKRQMIQTFQNMLQSNDSFVDCVKFIMDKANKPFDQEQKNSMVQRAEDFFRAPITRGLGYVDGENQIVNSPNPNENGATNNSYYN